MIVKLLLFNMVSIGLQADPLIWGLNIRAGKTEGIRFGIITGYYFTYTPVDSAKYTPDNTVYSESYSKPEYKFSIGLRGEYFFKNLNGIEPYTSFGIEYYYRKGWISIMKIKNDTTFLNPEEEKIFYLGMILSMGIEVYPLDVFSNLLKLEENTTKVISFNFEVNTYYKPLRKFSDYPYWTTHSITGINIGTGVRINF